MPEPETNRASGFHWNAGGWFGAQIGMTAYMLVMAIVLLPVAGTIALGVVSVFVVANIVGVVMWLRRHTMSAYKALQILVIVAGLCGFAAFYFVDSGGAWDHIQRYGGAFSVRSVYILLAILVIGLLLLFRLINGRVRQSPNKQ